MSYNYSHAKIELEFSHPCFELTWLQIYQAQSKSGEQLAPEETKAPESKWHPHNCLFLKEEIAIFLKVWFWFEGTNYLFNTIVNFWKIPNHSIASCDLTLEMKNYNCSNSKVLIGTDQLFLRIFLRSKYSLTMKRIYMYSLYCRRISRRLQHNFPLFGRFLRNKSTSASDVK